MRACAATAGAQRLQRGHGKPGVQGKSNEQAEADCETAVGVLAGGAVHDGRADQDQDIHDHVRPEGRWKPAGDHAIQLGRAVDADQQHPEEKHPQAWTDFQREPEHDRDPACEEHGGHHVATGCPCADGRSLLAQHYAFGDDRHVLGWIRQEQQQGRKHDQRRAQRDPPDLNRIDCRGLCRLGLARVLGKKGIGDPLADDRHADADQHPLDQIERQVIAHHSDRGDQGKTERQERAEELLVEPDADVCAQINAHCNEQQRGHRILAEQRSQHQPDTESDGDHENQAEQSFQSRRWSRRGRQHQSEYRAEKRKLQPDAIGKRERQRHDKAEPEHAPGADRHHVSVRLNRHTTANSPREYRPYPGAAAVWCLRRRR